MAGDTDKEPTMEEILASIRRIISEDGENKPEQQRPQPLTVPEPRIEPEGRFVPPSHDVLELTDPAPEPAPQPTGIISETTAAVASQSLSALSAMLVRNYEGSENTLEGLVREMLKPMLREWLDANLPDIVEKMVAREIARITGRPS